MTTNDAPDKCLSCGHDDPHNQWNYSSEIRMCNWTCSRPHCWCTTFERDLAASQAQIAELLIEVQKQAGILDDQREELDRYENEMGLLPEDCSLVDAMRQWRKCEERLAEKDAEIDRLKAEAAQNDRNFEALDRRRMEEVAAANREAPGVAGGFVGVTVHHRVMRALRTGFMARMPFDNTDDVWIGADDRPLDEWERERGFPDIDAEPIP